MPGDALQCVAFLDNIADFPAVIPHGAGYSLPNLSRVRRVKDVGGTRYFDLERLGQSDTQVISDPGFYNYGGRTLRIH